MESEGAHEVTTFGTSGSDSFHTSDPSTESEKKPGNEVISDPVWSDSLTRTSDVVPLGDGVIV